MSAKTITIFLPSGNPSGIKEVELSNRIIKAILIPRAKIKESKNLEELNQPAIYFLCEKNGEQIYIGESENFYSRVKNHDQNKEFWEIAIAFVAKDNSLEKGDVKYLEALSIEIGKEANRFELTNTTAPPKNNLHRFKQTVVEEFFEDVKILVSALGYPIFDKIDEDKIDEKELWFIKNRGASAKGLYNEDGFTLLKDSIIPLDTVPSFKERLPAAYKKRLDIIKNNCEIASDGFFKLNESITFNSPSYSAAIALGRNTNGWTAWKNKDGKTLDEVFRSGD